MGRRVILLMIAVVSAAAAAALLALGFHAAWGQTEGAVSGIVVDDTGPVSGAHVRMRLTDNLTFSDADGHFVLEGVPEGSEIEITSWSDGYYIASKHVTPTISGITLTLRPYHTVDHPEYDWVSPISGTSETACGNCHPMIIGQWQENAHGTAIDNARFFSLYNGTNLSGTMEVEPGFLDDFPNADGLCASCHAPGAGIDGYLTTNMNAVRGQITSGVHCDYCHKTGGVFLDPASGSVYPNAPGAESQRILRPPLGDQIFFGPYDDVHDPDTYLPLISESAFCAPCHQFSFWGTPIYESYGEWLASPYSEQGVTCQKCHMPPNGDEYFALPEVGGLAHPPETIPSHLQLGAADIGLLQDTAELRLEAEQLFGELRVTVVVSNTGAGHHVPTDFPGRQLILEIEAEGGGGGELVQVEGPVIADWGGPQAGRPGMIYAKLLKDVASGDFPVVSYWKQALIVSDNRIPALAADDSTFSFEIPAGEEEVHLTARLLFRRLPWDTAQEKEWDMPDIVMEEETAVVSVDSWQEFFLPLAVNAEN
jgi:hypothetical protein